MNAGLRGSVDGPGSDTAGAVGTPGPAGRGGTRRRFVKHALAVGMGVMAGTVPLGAALSLLLAPLRRGGARRRAVFVTTLSAVPDDGTPCRFPIVTTRVDAWTRSEGVVGAVYLRRSGPGVVALNVACPHAGCFVDYSATSGDFHCPCHHSRFSLDGGIRDARSPAPRGMDALEVEIRGGHEVWVAFQNFRAGEPKKVPV
jgi:menaquinol-cytochrome c reductase iron-sulfur subunit